MCVAHCAVWHAGQPPSAAWQDSRVAKSPVASVLDDLIVGCASPSLNCCTRSHSRSRTAPTKCVPAAGHELCEPTSTVQPHQLLQTQTKLAFRGSNKTGIQGLKQNWHSRSQTKLACQGSFFVGTHNIEGPVAHPSRPSRVYRSSQTRLRVSRLRPSRLLGQACVVCWAVQRVCVRCSVARPLAHQAEQQWPSVSTGHRSRRPSELARPSAVLLGIDRPTAQRYVRRVSSLLSLARHAAHRDKRSDSAQPALPHWHRRHCTAASPQTPPECVCRITTSKTTSQGC